MRGVSCGCQIWILVLLGICKTCQKLMFKDLGVCKPCQSSCLRIHKHVKTSYLLFICPAPCKAHGMTVVMPLCSAKLLFSRTYKFSCLAIFSGGFSIVRNKCVTFAPYHPRLREESLSADLSGIVMIA